MNNITTRKGFMFDVQGVCSYVCIHMSKSLIAVSKASIIGLYNVCGSTGVLRSSSPSVVRGNKILHNCLHRGLTQLNAGGNSSNIALNPPTPISYSLFRVILLKLPLYHSLRILSTSLSFSL
jgi:hypothetical protein